MLIGDGIYTGEVLINYKYAIISNVSMNAKEQTLINKDVLITSER